MEVSKALIKLGVQYIEIGERERERERDRERARNCSFEPDLKQ